MPVNGQTVNIQYYSRTAFNALSSKNTNTIYFVEESNGKIAIYVGASQVNYLTAITKGMVEGVLTGTITTHAHAISQITGLQTELDGKEPTFTKNTAFNKNFGTTAGTVTQGNDSRLSNARASNDVLAWAKIGNSDTIPTSKLPSLAITDTFEVATQSAMTSLTAQKGDIAIRTDLNKTFILSAEPASSLGNWKELKTPTDAVLSVAGLTGAITSSSLKTSLSLNNVENKSSSTIRSEITVGNIPNLDTSKITTGTMSKSRLPSDITYDLATALKNLPDI